MKVAIIGAGFSGLVLAHSLKMHADVTIFEKSRGVGGRIATRRADNCDFDHGSQFFKVKSLKFASFLEPLIAKGVIKVWQARFAEFSKEGRLRSYKWNNEIPHYVGAPNMNAIARYLAEDLQIIRSTEIVGLKRSSSWSLSSANNKEYADFDWVVCTAPAMQTATIIPSSFLYYDALLATQMSGCYSLLLSFIEPLPLDFDAALVRDMNISWISVNSSKPGRQGLYTLLIHSTNKWAEDNSCLDKDKVMAHLTIEAEKVIGYSMDSACHKDLHFWRYANMKKRELLPVLIDVPQQLACCGDWCLQGRIEAAFTSAVQLAAAMAATIS